MKTYSKYYKYSKKSYTIQILSQGTKKLTSNFTRQYTPKYPKSKVIVGLF